MTSLKNRFLRGLRWRMARRRLQPLYESLHAWAMYGMNVGGATRSFEASGEAGFVESLSVRGDRFTCIDVGANIGDYAKLVLGHLGERCDLWCFEPAPATYQDLVANMGTKARCFELALSDTETRTMLYVDARGSVFSSLTAQPGTTPHAVQTMRLDDFAAQHRIEHIDLLKIDVEGHELAVLRGAKRLIEESAIDRIQFEYGENNSAVGARLQHFYELLGERYEIHRIVRDGLWPLGAYRASLEISASATNYVAIARALR